MTGVEKAIGKTESISITSDSGRLTAAEIEQMLKNAEQFAEEDRIIKEKLDSKHDLQNYIYQMRNTIEDRDKLADKMNEDDKNAIASALTEAEDWLNSNTDAEKDDIDYQKRELQSVCDPIIAQIYNSQGG